MRAIRLLYWTREGFPIYRVDVDVLFGRELVSRGHEIDIVIQAETPAVKEGSHDWYGRTAFVGKTVDGAGPLVPFLKHWLAIRHDIRCFRLARLQHYDAIQFRDKFLIAAIGLIVARARGLKFFYWLSFPYPDSDLSRARSKETRFPFFTYIRGLVSGWLLYKCILPWADHAFVQSEQMRRDFIARGLDGSRLSAVPMGIRLADVSSNSRGSHRLSNDELVIGYLGALDKDRRLEMLMDMLVQLNSSRIKVRLLLIGDAQVAGDRQLLVDRAAKLGVSNQVEITGFLPRLEALRRMQAADIALSPIYPSEMFRVASPTKLVEYLALGIPVVANHHPEQKFILRGSRAGICCPWGGAHFARSVRWLATLTAEQRMEMGRRGREWVEQHRSYERIADQLESKYLELIPLNARKSTAGP